MTAHISHQESNSEYVSSVSPDQTDENKENIFENNMKHRKRGYFVIFNNQNFEGQNERRGSGKDRDDLRQTAEALGFETRTHDNFTHNEIDADKDHLNMDCFACVVMMHGDEGDILYAKDEMYHAQELFEPIRYCKSLIEKPKLFFIQACRGDSYDVGVVKGDNITKKNSALNKKSQETPIEADFFIGRSTPEGYYSWRNEEKGSWYMQSLRKCLLEYRDMEFMRIMTRVNGEVAGKYAAYVNGSVGSSPSNRVKQIPTIMSRLTRELYFPSANESADVVGKIDRKPMNPTSDREQGSLNKELVDVSLELFKISKLRLELKQKKKEVMEKVYKATQFTSIE